MIILSTLAGLSELQIAETLLAQSDNENKLNDALNELCPSGRGGVGHAQAKRKANLLELIRELRAEPRLHISFYQAPGLC